ncbi:MAG: VWA domain-containing protein [Brevinematales bacterium]|nr:VWA domain-containing protein [Brevinematales bacterium]
MRRIGTAYILLLMGIVLGFIASCGGTAAKEGLTKPTSGPAEDGKKTDKSEYFKDDDTKPVKQSGKSEVVDSLSVEEKNKGEGEKTLMDGDVVPGKTIGGAETGPVVDKTAPEKKFDKENVPMAGEHDDNEEYQYYLDFLVKEFPNYKSKSPMIKDLKPVQEFLPYRNIVTVCDKNGKPVFGAEVKIDNVNYTTYQDGEILYYPKQSDLKKEKAVAVKYQGKSYHFSYTPDFYERPVFTLDIAREETPKIPIDIVFLMDTTGSMGDEIEKLCNTIYSINERIVKISKGNILARFGMVLYRDDTDDYLTKEFPLTDKFDSFYGFLMGVDANGGGDYPEAMLDGIKKTLALNWNNNSIKLVFLVTDAPAKLKSLLELTGLAQEAEAKQIKFFTVGASELDLVGEIHLRILSQMTKGNFIFLTYGEKGESSGGATPEDPGMVSHHTGANYQSRSLDDIIVDNVKKEIYNLADQGLVAQLKKEYDYKNFTDEIYRRIDNAIQQIMKQTAGNMGAKKSVMVLPPDIEGDDLKLLSSHVITVTEDIFVKYKYLTVVERQKMEAILDEIKLKLAQVVEGSDEIKQLTGADTILASKLYYVGGVRVYFAKLIDASTGEIMASALVKM